MGDQDTPDAAHAIRFSALVVEASDYLANKMGTHEIEDELAELLATHANGTMLDVAGSLFKPKLGLRGKLKKLPEWTQWTKEANQLMIFCKQDSVSSILGEIQANTPYGEIEENARSLGVLIDKTIDESGKKRKDNVDATPEPAKRAKADKKDTPQEMVENKVDEPTPLTEDDAPKPCSNQAKETSSMSKDQMFDILARGSAMYVNNLCVFSL